MKKKKSLGQHFLHSASYVRAVADAANLQKGDTVLEIGPGDGALTKELLASGCKVLAIEKDHRLIPLLQEKFAQEIKKGQLTLIEGDALEFEPSDYTLEARGYKLVGNIPYYITGALLKKFLSADNQPESLVFLIQKEVAERITHRGPSHKKVKESILSLSVKAYGDPVYIKTVPAGAFSPPPKVDSAILAVRNVSRTNFKSTAHEKKFFELIKKGFSQKRKLLVNNLGTEHSHILENLRIDSKARAEDVPLSTWLALSR